MVLKTLEHPAPLKYQQLTVAQGASAWPRPIA
jgi:hypothetical protein